VIVLPRPWIGWRLPLRLRPINPSTVTVTKLRHGAAMRLIDITMDTMRSAFSTFAQTHEAATIRRCRSSWNVLCTFLYNSEGVDALVGGPKLPKTLPKALPRTAVQCAPRDSRPRRKKIARQTDWAEGDLAIILTGLLAGLRVDEVCQAIIGGIRQAGRDQSRTNTSMSRNVRMAGR
jgi:integrase